LMRLYCILIFYYPVPSCCCCLLFFFHDSATTEIYTLSLHDALPICIWMMAKRRRTNGRFTSTHYCRYIGKKLSITSNTAEKVYRSEEHTSELQSRFDLVCRLLLEKKKKQ